MVYFSIYSCLYFSVLNFSEFYTLSLHVALPICSRDSGNLDQISPSYRNVFLALPSDRQATAQQRELIDRKSTRLNSSHVEKSYAVFCAKKNIFFKQLACKEVTC